MQDGIFNQPVIDLIKIRSSWRSYTSKSLDQVVLDKILEYLSRQNIGPLKSKSRFHLISMDDPVIIDNHRLHTYGFIKNARNFIVGAVEFSDSHWIDFGYLLEKIILMMTDLGLGTCWLGGTFSRSEFADSIKVRKNEVIPAVSPLGFATGNRSLRDQIIRWGAKSRNRRSRNSLFFKENFGEHLPSDQTSKYETVLEMVRLGPSASNRQPWRVVKIGNDYHLFLQRTKKYEMIVKDTDLQLVDMGIAMCHFELTANELGLPGHWVKDNPKIPIPDLAEYVVTWIPG